MITLQKKDRSIIENAEWKTKTQKPSNKTNNQQNTKLILLLHIMTQIPNSSMRRSESEQQQQPSELVHCSGSGSSSGPQEEEQEEEEQEDGMSRLITRRTARTPRQSLTQRLFDNGSSSSSYNNNNNNETNHHHLDHHYGSCSSILLLFLLFLGRLWHVFSLVIEIYWETKQTRFFIGLAAFSLIPLTIVLMICIQYIVTNIFGTTNVNDPQYIHKNFTGIRTYTPCVVFLFCFLFVYVYVCVCVWLGLVCCVLSVLKNETPVKREETHHHHSLSHTKYTFFCLLSLFVFFFHLLYIHLYTLYISF